MFVSKVLSCSTWMAPSAPTYGLRSSFRNRDGISIEKLKDDKDKRSMSRQSHAPFPTRKAGVNLLLIAIFLEYHT